MSLKPAFISVREEAPLLDEFKAGDRSITVDANLIASYKPVVKGTRIMFREAVTLNQHNPNTLLVTESFEEVDRLIKAALTP